MRWLIFNGSLNFLSSSQIWIIWKNFYAVSSKTIIQGKLILLFNIEELHGQHHLFVCSTLPSTYQRTIYNIDLEVTFIILKLTLFDQNSNQFTKLRNILPWLLLRGLILKGN